MSLREAEPLSVIPSEREALKTSMPPLSQENHHICEEGIVARACSHSIFELGELSRAVAPFENCHATLDLVLHPCFQGGGIACWRNHAINVRTLRAALVVWEGRRRLLAIDGGDVREEEGRTANIGQRMIEGDTNAAAAAAAAAIAAIAAIAIAAAVAGVD